MHVYLQNKTILITGGTGGLGQALVKVFLEEGAQVVFTYHAHQDRAEVLEQFGARGYQTDFSNRKSIFNFLSRMKQDYSRLDGMIHNAGISRDRTIDKMEEAEFDETIQVNLTAIFMISRELLPLLDQSDNAKILNVTSRVGIRGNFGQTAYAASKAGLIALTKNMADEWGIKGISVNAITPGYVMSDMTRSLPEEVHEKARSESVLGKISDADEVARFAAYLMSDHVRHLSGQIFHYDTRRM